MGGGLVSRNVLEPKHILTLASGNCLVWGLEGGKAPSPSHLSLELDSMWFSPGYQRALYWVFRHQYSK